MCVVAEVDVHALVQAVMQAGTAGASAEKGIRSTGAKTPMVSQSVVCQPVSHLLLPVDLL